MSCACIYITVYSHFIECYIRLKMGHNTSLPTIVVSKYFIICLFCEIETQNH